MKFSSGLGRRRGRAFSTEKEFPTPLVEIEQVMVNGVIDKLRQSFHPGPFGEERSPGVALSEDQIELVTAAFLVGLFDYELREQSQRTFEAMASRVSFDEAVHYGNFGYFTRENVHPEVAPALENIYQFVGDRFRVINQWRLTSTNQPGTD